MGQKKKSLKERFGIVTAIAATPTLMVLCLAWMLQFGGGRLGKEFAIAAVIGWLITAGMQYMGLRESGDL